MHALVLELWRVHGPAVLLVTHDVDEAISLADRVLGLDAGRIALDVAIDLPRPRDTTDPARADLRRRFLETLGVKELVV
jgi:sulfonate transport system ATP-binding protein